MPSGIYDTASTRMLSEALATALVQLNSAAQLPLMASQLTEPTRAITQGLMRAFDSGERDPAELVRLGLLATRRG